jgi:hypothetical protein
MTKFKKLAKGGSVVDVINAAGLDSSFNSRKKLAQELGIKDYKGTVEQNLYMSDILHSEYGDDKNFINRLESIEHSSKSNESKQSTKYTPIPERSKYRPPVKEMPKEDAGFSPLFLKSGQVSGGSKYNSQPSEAERVTQEMEAKGFRFTPSMREKEGQTYDWYERNVKNPLENKGVNTDAIEFGVNGAATIASGAGLVSAIKNAPVMARNIGRLAMKGKIGKGVRAATRSLLNNVESAKISSFNELPKGITFIKNVKNPNLIPLMKRTTVIKNVNKPNIVTRFKK